MPGAVALARETGAPLVPMAIWGPQRILTAKRPVDLHRGRPVSLLVGAPRPVGRGDDLREARPDGSGRRSRGCWTSSRAARCTGRTSGRARAVAPGPPRRLGADPERAPAQQESVPSSAVAPSWLPPRARCRGRA